MQENHKIRPYSTNNTAEASYLTINGMTLQNIDTESDPASFVFKAKATEENIKLTELIMAWDTGYANGNCHAFYHTYKSYIRKIMTSKQSR